MIRITIAIHLIDPSLLKNMAISPKFSTKPQLKSISLPCRPHPTTLDIQQHLHTANTAAAFAASNPSLNTITTALSHLPLLYNCMHDLVNLSTIRVLFSRNKKWVEQLIDESVSFLDVCGSLKDIVTQIKSHVRGLQCCLRRRRRKCELSKEQSVVSYNCFRKTLKKDINLLKGRLKQVETMIAGGGSVVVETDNHQLAAVMKAVIGVSETAVSVFESLLWLLSMPNSKQNRWRIVVSKLMHKGMVRCEDNQEQGTVNEFGKVEDALRSLCNNGSSVQDEEVQIAKWRLEMMESRVECLERGLECLFRRLIGNRGSLLNIISM